MELFRINSDKKKLEKIPSTTLSSHGFTEPKDLESWIAENDAEIFGARILWISRQDYPTPDQRSDLIGVDEAGELVICELKQGIVSTPAITQALGYAAEYSKLNIDDLAQKLVLHIQKGHGNQLKASTFEEAKQAISSVVIRDNPSSETPVNETQRIILIGEGFDPNVLSISDYLNNASESSCYLIECWRCTLFALENSQFQLAFEQILPPPSIREQIAELREANRARKYARDQNRIAFMYWFMAALRDGGTHEARRSPGASYSCNVIGKGKENNQYTFSIHTDHPRLGFPNDIASDKLPPDLANKIVTEGNIRYIEFVQYECVNLSQDRSIISAITDVVDKMNAT